MNHPTPLLTACPPRPIHQAGDQYAADLTRGLAQELAAPDQADDFLATTHLTPAVNDFLRMAMTRIARGPDSTSPSVYQLYSRYGGGKTHSLLLLAAAALYPRLDYWRHAAQLDFDPAPAKVIAFNGGEPNIDGEIMDDQGSRARSLTGYLLHRLGGADALHEFREADNIMTDPGSAAFRRLIGDDPVIIVIDELVRYINRVNQRAAADSKIAKDGVLTTLSALADAVAGSPRAVLVITTPEDSHDLLEESAAANTANAGDAHHADALALTDMLDRINSQMGRVMHPVAPSGEADLPAILRKRLFYQTDETARHETASAYAAVAARNGRTSGLLDQQSFYNAYPFHPWLLEIITTRLSANRNFQRVRGTLRLLGNTLRQMQEAGDDAPLLHPYHLTPRAAPIRDELVNRIGFSALDAAIETDITGRNSTADKTGSDLAEPAAITMLLGTIAPENANGLYQDQIAEALLSPRNGDYGLLSSAIDEFLSRAIYVDDSPQTQRRRFSKDPNVMKELLEVRDSILADTEASSNLLKQAIASAYGAAANSRDRSNRGDRLQIVIFPSRQSNVPDNPGHATLGIVNPDHWNWSDASVPANGMSNHDLLDLHRHSSNSDGAAPRQYPNNALLLAAHDANLSRIREDLATMEAAERLLIPAPGRALPPHRQDTLKSIQTSSEKNATIGIQNKFTHLFSAGNSSQHQWPEPHSHLEHRALESLNDAVGQGQESILQALGDRVLRGPAAALNRSAWARIRIIAGEQGCTLGELRDYFARTPAERIIINDAAWRALIANGISNDALHLVTPSGEVNPAGYDPDWRVWAKGYEPQPEPDRAEPAPDPSDADAPADPSGPLDVIPRRQTSFASGQLPGKAAYEAVKRFMADNGHDWPALISCQVTGTSPALADQIASIAQSGDTGIQISLLAQNEQIQVAIRNASPQDFKDYANPARRILTKAGVSNADISIQLEPAAAPDVLEKLNNRDEANIRVSFQ